MSDVDIPNHTLKELREWLRHLNLPTSGNKPTLILRLKSVSPDERGVCPQVQVDAEHVDDSGEETEGDYVPACDGGGVVENANSLSSINKELELIKREMVLVQKEKMLLERENELLKKSVNTSSPPVLASVQKSEFAFSTVKDLLPEYDGSGSIELWVSQLQNVGTMCALSNDVLKALLMSKLKGSAQAWLHSKADYVSEKVEILIEQMRETFKLQGGKLQQRRKFENKKWVYGERFADYYNAKMLLANGLQMEEPELVEHLVEGISDVHLRTQATIQCFDSAEKLLRAFTNVELRRPYKADNNTATASRTAGNIVRCFNCNSLGHYASACTKPRREMGACFGCGSLEHKVTTCPQRKTVHMIQNDDSVSAFKFYVDKFGYFVTFCLIDSGSPISFIQKRCVPNDIKIMKCNKSYFGLNKSVLKIVGQISCFLFPNNVKPIKLIVVDNDSMGYDAVVGRDFMNKYGIRLKFENNLCNGECSISDSPYSMSEVKYTESVLNLKPIDIFCKNDSLVAEKLVCQNDSLIPKMIVEENGSEIFAIECDSNYENDSYKVGNNLTSTELTYLKSMLNINYLNVERPLEPNFKSFMKLSLKDTKPFYCPPRRLSYAEKNELQKLLDEYIEKGYIRASESEFVSPIVLVKKKTGDIRMCVDYRTLNKVTNKDNFPIPLIDDLLDRLANKKLFTKLDLKNGFFHVFMDEESIKFTSFTTPMGQYEFTRMPFGLRNAPSVFQRFVNRVFSDMLKANEVIIYLDDIMIATENAEEHFQILEKVLLRLVQNNLELRMDKCEFLKSEVKYLGYIITDKGIKPDEKGIDAVNNFPIPKTTRTVQSFLGLCSYFRRFVKNFSIIAKPLYDLTRKDQKFHFGEVELDCFENLKKKLVESPILAIYDPNDPIELHCDASSLGFGAILFQKKADKNWHPVFYFSKRTTDSESKYHSFELETLSIIYALKRFRIYLHGKNFKIITDCNSLTMTLKKKDLNHRIARWALELQNFDYILEHRSGKRMQHVDALSRNNVLVVEANSLEDNLVIWQNKDAKLCEIRKLLEKQEHKFYEMRNGIVYRKKEDGRILFCVPEHMESHVMYKYHDELGHVGIDKVVDMIGKSYWFSKMREKVNKHIQNCLRCIAFSDKTGRTEGFLHNIPKSCNPFEVIHIDHIGPIENPKNKLKHILVIIDGGTKFTRLYPTNTTKSKEAIQALNDYFRAYSRPRCIVSDRGSCFTSVEFEDFLRSNNVQHIKIATGSPQANGQAERVNRSIGPMLAKFSQPDKGIYWYKMIECVEYAINNTVHRATNEHPSIMLFGTNQRGKVIDSLKENFIEKIQSSEKPDLCDVRKEAKENEEKLQLYNENYINKKRREPIKFKEGDYVMVKNFDSHIGSSKKLIPKFKGPYKVLKILKNDRYVLVDVDGFQQTQMPYKGVWAIGNMRPWVDQNK